MQIAFVVRFDSISTIERLDPNPPVAELGFAARQHFTWADRSNRVHLDVWVGPGSQAAEPDWNHGVRLFSGHRLTNEHGYEFGSLAEPMPHLSPDRSNGMYVGLALDADGTGSIWNDPIGFRCLYTSEVGSRTVFGSRAAIVARARGVPRERDVQHAAWLAWLAHWAGDSTGYLGVSVVQAGTTISVNDAVPTTTRHVLPWSTPNAFQGRDVVDLADVAIAELTTAMVSLARSPERPVLRLTGGRDSRVLLASAIAAGVEHEFDYLTIGPPTLPDVVVASEIAQRYGLHHTAEFIGRGTGEIWSEVATSYANACAGMVSIFDARNATSHNGVEVTGVCGELLRASIRSRSRTGLEADVRRQFRADRYNGLGLVDPTVFEELHAELLASIFDPVDAQGLDAYDLVQRHAVTSAMRMVRLGPSSELTADRTVQPFNSIRAAHAAHALDGTQRQDEILVATILHRTAPDLINIPFVGPDWSESATAHLGSLGHKFDTTPKPATPALSPPTPSSPTPSSPAPASSVPKPVTLMQQMSRAGSRVDFLHDVLSDTTSAAWSVLSRDAAHVALARFDELTGLERRHLFGAATAVLWLSNGSTS